MFCKINTGMLGGIDGVRITAECDMRNGMPAFNMIGDLSGEVKEAKDRVLTAMNNVEITLPIKKITVNLAPAGLHKRGGFFDLPIALAILGCMEEIETKALGDTIIIGELGLNGSVRKIKGALSITDMAVNEGFKKIILPYENAVEASVIEDIDVIGVKTLKETIDYIKGNTEIKPVKFDREDYIKNKKRFIYEDFKDVAGQGAIKRAVEIAVSGKHNLLMIGTPGSGKSMISKRIPGIMPPMSIKESIEVSKIFSVCGMLDQDNPLIIKRPFRSPHHTVSAQALAGGGRYPTPGEVSLSHKGILFLDELPEFQSKSLEILRQPMEDKKITISRTGGKYTYPADFQLISAMNPCPCGYYPNRNKCKCNENIIRNYLNKISGPMLDRIDICIEAPSIGVEELNCDISNNESSYDMSKRVEIAQEIQKERFRDTDYQFNSQILPSDFNRLCHTTKSAKGLLNNAFKKYSMTARAYHKIIKVARTIADIEQSQKIEEEHMAEAIYYRSIDAKYWGGDENN